MLTREDLTEYARLMRFSLSQVERDYLQHILLLSIYRRVGDELVFKGGTALQKCYGLDRFSEDLDFSLFRPMNIESVTEEVTGSMNLFGFETSLERMKEDETSISSRIKVKGPLYDGREKSAVYVRIEVSKREKTILPPRKTRITPVYRDLPAYMVCMMDPSEIMAEKVRAILTRERSRDLYDLYFLVEKRIKTDIKMIEEKLRYYDMRFEYDKFVTSIERKRKLWWNELRYLVPEVPDFDDVKAVVVEWMEKIISKCR